MLRYLPILALATLVVLIFLAIFVFPRSQTTISGTIDLNGTPPPGSTISVLQSPQGHNQFSTVVANILPNDQAVWSWSGARSGQNYDLKLQLLDSSGREIDTGNAQTVTAPATNVALRINYSSPLAQLPTTTASSPSPSPAPAFITGTLDSPVITYR